MWDITGFPTYSFLDAPLIQKMSSSSTDFSSMLSWFTHMNSLVLRVRQLESRIEELENLYGKQAAPTRAVGASALPVPIVAAPPVAEKKAKEDKKPRAPRRKRTFADVLVNGDHIVARIPLGDRTFREYNVRYEGDKFIVEDSSESYDNPNRMVADMAAALVASGERNPDCKSPLNAWTLCSVLRGEKRILLDKATKPSATAEEAEEAEEEEDAEENAEE